MKLRAFLGSLVFVACLGLAACNEQGSGDQKKQAEISEDQAQTRKFNAYIGVANSIRSPFATKLEEYQKNYAPALASGEKITSYSVVTSFAVNNLKKKLDDAIAMPFSMLDIDKPAGEFSSALAAFQPLNAELSNYADSKEYLTDGGQKARENSAAYIEALTQVAKAERAFLEGVDRQDEQNIRDAFEKAEKDSRDYYRYGLIIESRATMTEARQVLESNGDKNAVEALKAAIAKTAAMASGWEKALPESQKESCSSLRGSMNDFLAMSRTIIQHAENGDYVPKPDSISWRVNNPIQYDANTLNTRFNSMVGALNRPMCR